MTGFFSRSANDTNAQGSFGDLSSIFHVLNNPGEVITEVTQFESNTNYVPVPPNYYFCKKCGKFFLADDSLRIHMLTVKRHFSDAQIVLKHFLVLLSFHIM
jgi:hypothetical protein